MGRMVPAGGSSDAPCGTPRRLDTGWYKGRLASTDRASRRDGRVVECTGLLSRRTPNGVPGVRIPLSPPLSPGPPRGPPTRVPIRFRAPARTGHVAAQPAGGSTSPLWVGRPDVGWPRRPLAGRWVRRGPAPRKERATAPRFLQPQERNVPRGAAPPSTNDREQANRVPRAEGRRRRAAAERLGNRPQSMRRTTQHRARGGALARLDGRRVEQVELTDRRHQSLGGRSTLEAVLADGGPA